MINRRYHNHPGLVIGSGPSLALELPAIQQSSACKIGVNNTYRDIALDAHVAYNVEWWDTYGAAINAHRAQRWFASYHWDRHTAAKYGLYYFKAGAGDLLSLDPATVTKGHSSSFIALGLAVLFGCNPIYLCGFDMDYPKDKPRHYFTDLSDTPGEYPEHLRKWSTFEGLRGGFDKIARQPGLPKIYNCTKASLLKSFEFAEIPK